MNPKYLLLFIPIFLKACMVQHFTNTYKVSDMSYDVNNRSIVGNEGSVLFKISSYGFDVDEALERCKLDAVYAILFEGIPNTNSKYPLISSKNVLLNNAVFFKSFFGVTDLQNFCNNNCRKRYGNSNASYRNYVFFASDGTIMERVKINKEVLITTVISVEKDRLKDLLIANKIIIQQFE